MAESIIESRMFKELKEFNTRPAPFQFYTAGELWANEHTAKQMLEYHLNETIDFSENSLKYAKQVAAQKEFEEYGFKVEEIYSDVTGKTFTLESPEIAIVAKKS